MKLIIDAGSTKSDWVILDNQSVVDTQHLDGINPTLKPESVSVIKNYESPYSGAFDEIHFYGSGVITDFQKEQVATTFRRKFNADSIRIHGDILAACRAVSHNQDSIVSIIGTGVNSVIFKNNDLTHRVKSLGPLLGAWGSGFYLGKLMIQFYYQNKISETDRSIFKNFFPSSEDLITHIYSQSDPKQYVAQLSRILTSFSKEFQSDILHQNFSDFFKNQISILPESKEYKLNFVGSIAYEFRDELIEISEMQGYHIDQIEKSPMNGLIKFHS